MEKLVGFDELSKTITILRNLQELVMSLVTCDEVQVSDESRKLFDYFHQISISNNLAIYEGFIRLFVHFSVHFISKDDQKNQKIYLNILNELISNHSLKTAFYPSSTLVSLFKLNKHFLLFMIKQGVIPVSSLKYEFLDDRFLFLFFVPEFRLDNKELYIECKREFCLDSEYITLIYESTKQSDQKLQFGNKLDMFRECSYDYEPPDFELNLEVRQNIHSNGELSCIIRKDDLDSFIHFLTENVKFSINSKITPSFLENNCDINDGYKGISLLEYSMAFGSINIFRYLWLNNVEYSEESLKYCIIGGNYEILHILEEESKFKFTKESYLTSLKYYQSKISEYLRNSLGIDSPTLFKSFSLINSTSNYEFLYKYFDNIINEIDCSNSQINENYKLQEKLIESYLLSNKLFYAFYSFITQNPEVDINKKDKIIILFKFWDFYLPFIVLFYIKHV
ncbi:hypothetical protein TRFO_06607 [Tritrichomonas foetus]|uniref:DUF3447 domain-containing protein n=1 Tax=Tritrichomonas foetus TaxID=1144522 RepID=A0A1J4JX81_9EUKA|nr:hypothetical protein TRFO_06607 [Tritrichomonas foetus]|eukprot:OHT03759.1 hypothetical protein TRFO_06607 [Tritrichomonas foetus]